MDLIESYARKETRKAREQVNRMFIHAEVVRRYLFPGEGVTEPPHPWEYYPELFSEEAVHYTEQREQVEFADYKVQRRAMFKEYNRRRQQGV